MTQHMLLRLDDASEYMNVEKWKRMERLLDEYGIKPIVGVIPNNQDPDMMEVYPKDPDFWDKVLRWQKKGWTIAMHGYTHVFETRVGGLNPVNERSEFAGVPLGRQKEKIRQGLALLHQHGIDPQIFFAPAHTFDENTLLALKTESNIRIISDTIANDLYYENGFYFVPQQSGCVRKLPFKVVTFCYHPNIMENADFEFLSIFLKKHRKNFQGVESLHFVDSPKTFVDEVLKTMYFFKRRIKRGSSKNGQ